MSERLTPRRLGRIQARAERENGMDLTTSLSVINEVRAAWARAEAAEAALAAARQEATTLKNCLADLLGYADHLESCATRSNSPANGVFPCDCGLNSVADRAEVLLEDPEEARAALLAEGIDPAAAAQKVRDLLHRVADEEAPRA